MMTLGAFDVDEDLRHAGREYWLERGWHTTVRGTQLTLTLDDDIWGLLMPTSLATALVTELHAMRLSCPVTELPGGHEPRSVVLLEPGDRHTTPWFPVAVNRLSAGTTVPLPPSTTPEGPVRWLDRHESAGAAQPSVRVVTDAFIRLT